MVAPPEEAGTNLVEIAKDIREELLRHTEALGTFGLGVLRKEHDVVAGGIEFEVTRDRERGDAAPPDRPSTVEGDLAKCFSFRMGLIPSSACVPAAACA